MKPIRLPFLSYGSKIEMVYCFIKKKGNNKVKQRPVSFLSALGMFFGRMLLAKLTSTVKGQNILSNEQFGFRPGDSTVLH